MAFGRSVLISQMQGRRRIGDLCMGVYSSCRALALDDAVFYRYNSGNQVFLGSLPWCAESQTNIIPGPFVLAQLTAVESRLGHKIEPIVNSVLYK
ncbi:unnamed protein product [Ixodes pacificus]